MINKHLTAFCDECTDTQHLVSQTLKEAAGELSNMGWTSPDKKHWYCPACSLRMVQERQEG